MSEFKNLTQENLQEEHICCAIGDKKHQEGVNKKKEWLAERIKEGHVFRKLNERGKVFIEYAPLEKAWCPIDGENYLYIYCLWVAGSFKGKGYGRELLEYVIEQAKRENKNGICVLSAKKKKPYLSEKKFFEKYGFKVVDTLEDYELLSLDFGEEKPKFRENVKNQTVENKEFTILYSPQCPFVEHCIEEVQKVAKEIEVPIHIEKIDTLEKAKNAPCIFNNWANFKEGKYVSNLLLNGNSFKKIIEK